MTSDLPSSIFADRASAQDFDQEEFHLLCSFIGDLIISFARLEGTLSAALRLTLFHRMGSDISKLDGEKDYEAMSVATGVFGSMRYNAARDIFKRIMALQPLDAEIRNNIDRVFAQAGEIQRFRDMLAHWQLDRAKDAESHTWRLANIVTVRRLPDLEVFEFNVEVIADARDDLRKINQLFGQGPVIGRDLIVDPERFRQLPTWPFRPSQLIPLGAGNCSNQP